MTSHDVVDFVRRLTGIKKAGHTGTLDPGAAGVLPICLGRATRLSEYILGSDKAYRAVMVLGITTDTQDAQGRVEAVRDSSAVTLVALEAVLDQFRGIILQVPPMVSAARHDGERLYRLARQGRTVERPARAVTIRSLDVVAWRAGSRAMAVLDIVCTKGTYVRAICHDVGQALGCGAYLDFLVRTRHGPFQLEDSVTLEELTDAAAAGAMDRFLLSPGRALAFLPQVILRDEEVRRLANGIPPAPRQAGEVSVPPPLAGRLIRLVTPRGDLLAVARLYPERTETALLGIHLEKVFVS